jgi:uncharacterized phage-like protein YoqJ
MIICGTGHRPDKLGGYSIEVFKNLVLLSEDYLKLLKPDKVISGMALGWDQALAEATINLNISLLCAIPFVGQETVWKEESKIKYNIILNKANTIYYVDKDGYAPEKLQIRNEWMVDNADLVLALWNGSSGGTYNCIKYAKRRFKPILNLFDIYKERYMNLDEDKF